MTDVLRFQPVSRLRKLDQWAKELRQAKHNLNFLVPFVENHMAGDQLKAARRYLATAVGGVAAVIHDIEKEQGE